MTRILFSFIFISSFLIVRAQSSNADQQFVFGQSKWTFKTDGKIFASPCVDAQVAYIGSEDGNMYALETQTGKLKWKYKTAGAIHSSATHHRGRIYFGSFDGNYYALDATSGKKVWSFKTGGEKWMGGKGYFGMKPDSMFMADPWEFYLSTPVVKEANGKTTVYFGSSDGNVYALNTKDGSQRWKFKAEGMIHSTPLLYNDLLLIGSWDTFLYAINAETGELKWKYKTGDKPGLSGIQASPVVANGLVYLGARDAKMHALDVNTGEVKWQYDAENSWILSNAVLRDSVVCFGTSDSFLVVALNAMTGKEIWRTPLNGYVYSTPIIFNKTLFAADFTGRIYAMDITNGKILSEFSTAGFKQFGEATLKDGKLDFMKAAGNKDLSLYTTATFVMDELYKLGAFLSCPTVVDNTLFIGSADGNLYAISLQKL